MERSLAAWKMTQDLKAAGGAAESQEPQGNLTSAIPDQRTETGPPAQEPHRIRAGLAPYLGLCAPPAQWGNPRSQERAGACPRPQVTLWLKEDRSPIC